MGRRKDSRNTRDAWRMARNVAFVFLAIVIMAIARQEEKKPDVAWLSDFQVKVETLKQNSPEVQFLYVPIEEKIKELKSGGYNRENLQSMFNMFESYIVTYFASKANIPGEYGEKYLAYQAMATDMLAELYERTCELEGR